ncbi:MAG: hypothetical protein H6725_15130 [Sandaracinaceae bacterium]|nr:hypothetical protein [Sandaracinaceae bacterium]
MRRDSIVFLIGLVAALVPGCNCINNLDRYHFDGEDLGLTDSGPDVGSLDSGHDGGDDGGSDDAGGDMGLDCSTLGAPVDYRLEALQIPTIDDAANARVLGHDVDAAPTMCGVPDYSGDVDNAWIDLTAALPSLGPDPLIDLQAELDSTFTCSGSSAACPEPPWTIRVASNGACAEVTILHGATQAVLAGPFPATVDGAGNLRGEFETLQFNIAYRTPGGPVSIPFVIHDGIFSAQLATLTLSNMVIGGSMPRAELDAPFTALLQAAGDGTTPLSVLTPILDALTDVMVGQTCSGLSIGLRGSASRCPNAGSPVVYRLGVLHVPTNSEAMGGAVVGQDVDDSGTVCAVPDYMQQVDNSLIDLAAALPALTPTDPVDLQGEIDTALACVVSGTTGTSCRRLDIHVRVATGDQCAIVSVTDQMGQVLAPQRVGTLSPQGALRVLLPTFTLAVPLITPGQPQTAVLPLSNAVFSASVSPSSLTNVVIGGYMSSAASEAFVAQLYLTSTDPVMPSDYRPILSNLYDVVVGGMCSAMSIGLTGAGTALP